MHALPAANRTWRFGRPARSDQVGIGISLAQLWILVCAVLCGYLVIGGTDIGAIPATVILTLTWGVMLLVGWSAPWDRPMDDWVAPITHYLTLKFNRRRVAEVPIPMVGTRLTHAMITAKGRPQEVGLLVTPTGTSMVLRVASGPFSLLDGDDQRSHLGAFGSWLASCADPRSPIDRVHIIDRVTPTDPDTSLAWAHYETGAVPGPATRPYHELLTTAVDGLSHETYVVLRITDASLSRSADLGHGLDRAKATPGALWRQWAHLQGRLREQATFTPLTKAELIRFIATQYDPHTLDGPVFPDTETGFGSYRCGATTHITGWAGGLPDRVTGPAWFSGFLLGDGLNLGPRTVSVVCRFTPAEKAARKVQRQQRARETAVLMRGGRLKASDAVTQNQFDQHEAELAIGAPQVNLAVYVDVTGPDLESARSAWRSARTSASRSHVDLRVLYGEQDKASGVWLPTGRGAKC